MADEATGDAQAKEKVYLDVPVVKGKGTVRICPSDIADDVWQEVIAQGLKVIINGGASKITKALYEGDEDKLKAAAMAKATERVAGMLDGTIKLSRKAAAKGVSGAVKTEAMRLARNLVKDELKRQQIKISHVAASDITAGAKLYLERDPSIIEMAKKNLAEREAVPVPEGIDLSALIRSDPKKNAAADAKAAKAKAEGLSAAKAGQVKTRAKGGQPTAH